MRSIAIRKAVLAAAVAALTVAAAPALVIHEPLLGLRWSAPATRFVPIDPSLKTRCANLVNANFDAHLWVLARDATPRGELLVVSGRSIPRRADLPSEPDDSGVLLRLHGGACQMIGPAVEPFADSEGYAPDVSRAELTALADDAARRYVTAFGGVRALCAAVHRQRVTIARRPAMIARAFRRAAPCLAARG